MDLLTFLVTVILITASGALAPGPLFFITVSQGARSGAKSGLIFSIAHSLVEFTFVILLSFGLLSFAKEPIIRLIVGVAGGITLILFGIIQTYNAFKSKLGKDKTTRIANKNLLLIGLAFTGLNPFFVGWWLTVGANLILLSLEFASFAGVILMYVCHVWMDYLWLTSIAYLSNKGTNVLEFRLYRFIIGIFGVILIYYGLTFLFNSTNL